MEQPGERTIHRCTASPAGRLLQGCLVFLPLAVLIQQLQSQLTNQHPSLQRLFYSYLNLGDGNPALMEVMRGRLLVRYLILGATSWMRWLHVPVPASAINDSLQVLCTWAALCVSFLWARRWLDAGHALAATLLIPPLICFGFLQQGGAISYPYDLPALLFSALALWSITSDRFRAFVVVLAIGICNKETVAWVVPGWFAFQFLRRVPLTRLALLRRSAVVTITCFVAYYGCRWITGPPITDSNVAGMTVDHVWLDDDQFLRPWGNVLELACLRLTKTVWRNIYWALALPCIPLILIRRVHPELRALCWGLPFLFAGSFVFMNIWEVRSFYAILPLTSVALVYLLTDHAPDSTHTRIPGTARSEPVPAGAR